MSMIVYTYKPLSLSYIAFKTYLTLFRSEWNKTEKKHYFIKTVYIYNLSSRSRKPKMLKNHICMKTNCHFCSWKSALYYTFLFVFKSTALGFYFLCIGQCLWQYKSGKCFELSGIRSICSTDTNILEYAYSRSIGNLRFSGYVV